MARTLVRLTLLAALAAVLVYVSVSFGRSAALCPLPRLAALYTTPDFQAEYTASNSGWSLSGDLTYWIVRDYAGRYINFKDGYRRTVGQPTTYTSTLWLVGNSTLVSAQVLDADTIASRLQALVPPGIRVVNVGMGGAYLIHEYNRLRTLPLAPGDTVVFYDGQLDAEAAQTDGDVARYRRVLGDAKQYAESRGVAFYHVLQPHLCTLQDSEWDRYLSAHFNAVCDTYTRWWPAFQATEDGVDFTHLYDDARRSGSVLFFDAHHSSEIGNVLAAWALYDLLFPVI